MRGFRILDFGTQNPDIIRKRNLGTSMRKYTLSGSSIGGCGCVLFCRRVLGQARLDGLLAVWRAAQQKQGAARPLANKRVRVALAPVPLAHTRTRKARARARVCGVRGLLAN